MSTYQERMAKAYRKRRRVVKRKRIVPVMSPVVVVKKMEAAETSWPSRVDREMWARGTSIMKRGVREDLTVAPAYNKGGYQVIPAKEIKDIGR